MYFIKQDNVAYAAMKSPEYSQLSLTEGKQLYLFSEEKIQKEFLDGFIHEGFKVHELFSRQLMEEDFASGPPDLILIIFNVPTMEEIGRCRQLRSSYQGPLLVLANQADEMLQVLGLEMGVDEFLLKPMSLALLIAKIRAVIRRSQEFQTANNQVIQLGQLVIDAGRREVRTSNTIVELTTREFDVLWCLAQNARIVLSRDDIHRYLYNTEYNGFDRSIDIYISRIRSKIGDDSLHPRYLKTVRGAGYLLTGDGRK